jgi:hypothetical protein
LILCRNCFWGDRDNAFLCEECAIGHDCDLDFLFPITNSPRLGVCGYYGSEHDKGGEGPAFVEAENILNEVSAIRHMIRYGSSTKKEKPTVIKGLLAELRGRPVGKKNFKVAGLIAANFEDFKEPLFELIKTAVTVEDKMENIVLGPAPVFALYLSAIDPKAEVFNLIAPLLREDAVVPSCWRNLFDEPIRLQPLITSLCRKNPELLLPAAADEAISFPMRVVLIGCLTALYIHEFLDKKSYDEYFESLIETALHNEDTTSADFLMATRTIVLSDPFIPEEGSYTLLEDPLLALEEVFSDPVWTQKIMFPAESFPTAPHTRDAGNYREDPAGTVKRESGKVGRNDPCPCGSGKKYKKCCGR